MYMHAWIGSSYSYMRNYIWSCMACKYERSVKNIIDYLPDDWSGQAQFLNGFQLSGYFRFVPLYCRATVSSGIVWLAKINLRKLPS